MIKYSTNFYFFRKRNRHSCISVFVPVCPFALDLVFLLDASGSIGIDNYRNVKEFINELIEHFQVSTAGK